MTVEVGVGSSVEVGVEVNVDVGVGVNKAKGFVDLDLPFLPFTRETALFFEAL